MTEHRKSVRPSRMVVCIYPGCEKSYIAKNAAWHLEEDCASPLGTFIYIYIYYFDPSILIYIYIYVHIYLLSLSLEFSIGLDSYDICRVFLSCGLYTILLLTLFLYSLGTQGDGHTRPGAATAATNRSKCTQYPDKGPSFGERRDLSGSYSSPLADGNAKNETIQSSAIREVKRYCVCVCVDRRVIDDIRSYR